MAVLRTFNPDCAVKDGGDEEVGVDCSLAIDEFEPMDSLMLFWLTSSAKLLTAFERTFRWALRYCVVHHRSDTIRIVARSSHGRNCLYPDLQAVSQCRTAQRGVCWRVDVEGHL
jgi:hypothetical protein